MRILLSAVIVVAAGPAFAQSTCEQLWYSRNAIFKEAGYCFKSTRAIRTFGNAGCQFDEQEDVPLSNRQRQDVNDIQRAERALRCPR
jgi:hypothetical protein